MDCLPPLTFLTTPSFFFALPTGNSCLMSCGILKNVLTAGILNIDPYKIQYNSIQLNANISFIFEIVQFHFYLY